ncbi:hypothetical protein MS_048 [Vibrio phage VPMS1]|uniref:hypothetical protein n=1 Tax=Vibrio phage VPMS1 TaxID=1233488 RepID=UPI0003585586|nr:hypothetical protein MS_048 [Vibrio phage VPMS1]AFV51127.1 hypothetical protein MS_048 [Vibrio phage VPMS1]
MGTYSNMHLKWRPGRPHRIAVGNDDAAAHQADLAIYCAIHAIRMEHLHACFMQLAPDGATQHELVLEVHTIHCYFMQGSDQVISSLSISIVRVKSWIAYNFL